MSTQPKRRTTNPLSAVFLGPFTHEDPTSRAHVARLGASVANACDSCGIALRRPWIDASAGPRRDHERVWIDDLRALWVSHVAIVLERPSLGNGVLLAWLHSFATPTIIVRRFGDPRSPIVHGIPTNLLANLEFGDPTDLHRALARELREALPVLTAARMKTQNVARERTSQLGEMVRTQRARLNLTLKDLAARTGLTPAWIEMIETEEWAMWGVSYGEVILLARALECPEWNLLAPASLTGFSTDEFRVIEEASRRGDWRQLEKDAFILAFHTLYTRSQGTPLTVEYVVRQFNRFKTIRGDDGRSA